MTGLAAFLAARLDDDEAAARAVLADESDWPCDPARVLREVEAKRAILKWHPSQRMRYIDASRCPQCELTWPCPTVRYLAAVYQDHPDYDPAWVPGG